MLGEKQSGVRFKFGVGPKSFSPRFQFGPLVAGAALWNSMGDIPAPLPMTLVYWRKYRLVSFLRGLPQEYISKSHPWLVQKEPEAHVPSLASWIAAFTGQKTGPRFEGVSYKDRSLLNALGDKYGKDSVRQDPLIHGEDVVQVQSQLAQLSAPSHQSGQLILIVRHLLEHSYHLEQTLACIRLYLGEGGVVLFEVPDSAYAFDRLDYSELWDEHLHYFDSLSLARVLSKNGFEVISTTTFYSDGEPVLCALASPRDSASSADAISQTPGRNPGANFVMKMETTRKRFALSLRSRQIEHVVFFGANHRTSNFIDSFLPSSIDASVVDDDSRKHGLLISGRGLAIETFLSMAPHPRSAVVVALNPQRGTPVRRRIEDHGWFPSQIHWIENFLNIQK